MANESATDKKVASTQGNDHDRVAMLSINKEGVPDQHDPEIIGDKDFAVEATKRQFAENAVSAIDAEARAASADTAAGEVKQDPEIAKLQKEHEKAEAAAEKSAESVVNSLHKG